MKSVAEDLWSGLAKRQVDFIVASIDNWSEFSSKPEIIIQRENRAALRGQLREDTGVKITSWWIR